MRYTYENGQLLVDRGLGFMPPQQPAQRYVTPPLGSVGQAQTGGFWVPVIGVIAAIWAASALFGGK